MWDKSWDTAEQREALLAIDFSPEALAGKLAYFETGLERLRKNLEKHGGERPPELAEPLPATERAWRAWLEYTGEENPFRSGTPDWKDWNSVWQTISLHTGEWEGYPDFSSPRVASELGLLIHPLPNGPRALGLASLLGGIWRDRNPFPERTWMAADWEEGWLKGVWIKGFLAWTWGKGQEHLDTLRAAASSAGILRPFEPASIESLSWLEGWDAARRRKIRDDGFEAGRRAHPEVPPEVERDSDDREAWQDGVEEGLETGRLERAFDRGGRSFDLGGSLRANPFPEGTPERSAWFQGWKSSHREIFAESNGTWRTFEECAEFGSYGHIVPALQEGVDAGLRDEPRSSNPFPPGSADASRWDRGWTDAQEYKLESEEVYEEEDEDHYFDDEFDEFKARVTAAKQAINNHADRRRELAAKLRIADLYNAEKAAS